MRFPYRSETSYKMETFAGILVIINAGLLYEWFFNLDYLIGLLYTDPDPLDVILFEICSSLLFIGCLIACFVIPRRLVIRSREKTGSLYLMTYGKKIPVDLTKCNIEEVFQTEVPMFSLVYQNYKSEPLRITKEK